MNFTIEKLKLEEVQTFHTLFSTLLKSEFPGYQTAVIDYFNNKIYTPPNYIYWLKNTQKYVLVAKNENREMVGFAVIDSPYGGVSLCRWLAVKKEFQKNGMGRELISTWIKMAKDMGCHKAEVAAQPEAKEFYAKMGLEPEGVRKLSYFGIDQYIFGIVLGEPDVQVMTRY